MTSSSDLRRPGRPIDGLPLPLPAASSSLMVEARRVWRSGLRRGWHLAAALQEPVQWLFKKRLRGAERKTRESVSPVSMDEYTRWLYDWPTRSAGAADAAKQVDRVGCCSPCCHAQRLAKGSAYSFVPRILEAEDKLEMLRRRHWEPAECPRARGACFISEALAMGALP